MAEQDRKTQRGKGKQPISRHPLFPATIALWFGALFGLGSIAIRPTLLEAFVVSLGIDTIIPAAAPPLGMTARILLALTMSGLGGLLGATIARRIARPKPEVRERTRGAASRFSAEESSASSRRRNLAMDESVAPTDYHDRAPLPGSSLQILNVNDVAPDDDETDARFAPSLSVAEEDAFDLAEYESAPESSATAPASISEPQPAPTDLESTDVHVRKFAAPDFKVPEFKPTAFESRVFGEQAAPANADFEPVARRFDAPCTDTLPPPAHEHAGEAPSPAAMAEQPAVQGEPVESFAARFAELAATSTRLFDARPAEAEPVPALAHRNADAHSRQDNEAPDPVPALAQATAVDIAPMEAPAVVELPETASATELQGFVLPDESAAERIVSAELGSLSQVELLERLGLSLDRRRKRVSEAVEDAHMAPVQEAPLADDDLEADVDAITAELAEKRETPFPPMFEVPAALRPIILNEAEDDDILPAFVPPRHIAMPQISEAEPEHVAEEPEQTEIAEAAAEVEGDEPVQTDVPAEVSETVAAVEDDEEARVLEDGYSSLLNLSRPVVQRQQFVRIEDPEDAGEAIEPVVVFPGQTASKVARDTTEVIQAIAPVVETETARPFDPPQKAANSVRPANSRQDPEETERALRAALASLQRMSGAA